MTLNDVLDAAFGKTREECPTLVLVADGSLRCRALHSRVSPDEFDYMAVNVAVHDYAIDTDEDAQRCARLSCQDALDLGLHLIALATKLAAEGGLELTGPAAEWRGDAVRQRVVSVAAAGVAGDAARGRDPSAAMLDLLTRYLEVP